MQLCVVPPNYAASQGLNGFFIGSSPGPIFEIQTSPTDFLRINEIQYASTGTGASSVYTIGLGFPAAAGIGLNGTAMIFEDGQLNNSQCNARIFTQWARLPTSPTNFLRRLSINALGLVSAGGTTHTIYTPIRFHRPLTIAPSSSFVGWMIINAQSVASAVMADLSIN